MDKNNAEKAFAQISSSKLVDLKDKMILAAIRYARIRVDWHLLTLSERKDFDSERTIAHNSFIDSCNILSRNMAKNGEDNSWRMLLGNDRKEIGDFACWLHLITGLHAR